MKCPKCESENVIVQQVQTGSIGAGTNKVVIEQPKKSKGCLYWLLVGWWAWVIKLFFLPVKFLFGGRKKAGINVHANKIFNKTVATCQNCGHSWNV